ncbi:hypothetical protein B0J17DRAFT_728836 [Rhizoctonia solani]|nr:hypothetical protein B0J17DRAFT_728836 [Rhizoctonia solani]
MTSPALSWLITLTHPVQSFSGFLVRNRVSKDGHQVRIADVEQSPGVDPPNHSLNNIITAGKSLTLDAFIRALKLEASSSTTGELVIARFQLRKSKRLPFRHEYVLLFLESRGVDYIIRVDRLGNLGSLTKGLRWHLVSFGIGGYSKDCVRIEEADSEAGRLLRNDAAGSNVLADLHHWSSIIKNKEDCIRLWKAATSLLKDINFGMSNSESSLLQQFMDAYDASSDPCFGLTTSNRTRFQAFEGAILRKLPDSIPDLLVQYLRVYAGQKLEFDDPAVRGTFALLGLSNNKHMNRKNPLFHCRVLVALSRPPLTLLDLSHRLEVLAKAWPAYNLVTTNCELFSRSLCYSNLSTKFCFVSNGYLRVPRTPGCPHIMPLLNLTAYHTLYIVILTLNVVLFVVLPFVLCLASTSRWLCADRLVKTPKECIDSGVKPRPILTEERRLVLVLIIWVTIVGNLVIIFLSALKLAGTRFLRIFILKSNEVATPFLWISAHYIVEGGRVLPQTTKFLNYMLTASMSFSKYGTHFIRKMF